MRFDLSAASYAGNLSIVICDPAAVPHLIVKKRGATLRDIDEEVERGNLLVYASGGDDRFRVYVDEEPEPELVARASGRVEGRLLRVPGGRILAAGWEFLKPGRKKLASPDEFEIAAPGMGSSASIPPGNYRVNAFHVAWDDEEIEQERKARLGPKALRLERILGPATGCVTLLSVLMLCALPGALAEGFARLPVLCVLAILIAVWPVLLLFWRSAAGRRIREVTKELDAQYPGAVVVLSRLPDGTDLSSLRGCKFGPESGA